MKFIDSDTLIKRVSFFFFIYFILKKILGCDTEFQKIATTQTIRSCYRNLERLFKGWYTKYWLAFKRINSEEYVGSWFMDIRRCCGTYQLITYFRYCGIFEWCSRHNSNNKKNNRRKLRQLELATARIRLTIGYLS